MRILVVEDETAAAALVAKGLREHGYAVDVAGTGPAALELVDLNTYDLVLLDVWLPGLDGFEVCRRMRDAGHTLPVLMLTARGGVDERVEGLDAGADDYLPKPFHFPELLARVRALLRRGPAWTSAVLQIDDLTLDTRQRVAARKGQTIRLTTKEYTLLEFMMRRPDSVVTRTDISEHVWDQNYDPLSNLIDVYIQRLRRKVDDGHPTRLIHTHRGAGYSLSAAEPDRA